MGILDKKFKIGNSEINFGSPIIGNPKKGEKLITVYTLGVGGSGPDVFFSKEEAEEVLEWADSRFKKWGYRINEIRVPESLYNTKIRNWNKKWKNELLEAAKTNKLMGLHL